MEQAIQQIIQQFAPQIWLGFVGFLTTGFMMLMLKNLVEDLVNYFKIRMSDLGKGAMIKWKDKLKMVKVIHFKEIEIFDDEEVVYIPIKIWIHSEKVYPKPRADQFNEAGWKSYDGKIERRQNR